MWPSKGGSQPDGGLVMTLRPAAVINATRVVRNREVNLTAPARCICYAAVSELACSPHDVDPRPALRDKIGNLGGLEYSQSLDGLLTEFVEIDLEQLKREYSGLFEVGSDGPPCPIREDLQTGQRGGTREDIVRFYNYFNYKLGDDFAWAPDHLSVELEFMHYLCYREASAEDDQTSFQFAQIDFSERHLVRWVPEFARDVAATAEHSMYSRVIPIINDFLMADFAWQGKTVYTEESNQG